jgi:hypothetical protein
LELRRKGSIKNLGLEITAEKEAEEEEDGEEEEERE